MTAIMDRTDLLVLKVRGLQAEVAEARADWRGKVAERDRVILQLWEKVGRSPERPSGLTHLRLAELVGVGESNVRRIVERGVVNR